MFNVLQAGLQHHAEYAYVVGHSDRSDEIWKPPDLDLEADWHYYGVDSDPKCILDWNQKGIPNTHWINVYLDGQPGLAKPGLVRAAIHQNAVDMGETVFVGKLTLSQLISELELTELELLVTDIEGSELPVFLEYNWHVRPRYLIVETHGNRIRDSLDRFFRYQGYRNLENRVTNDGMTIEIIYKRR